MSTSLGVVCDACHSMSL